MYDLNQSEESAETEKRILELIKDITEKFGEEVLYLKKGPVTKEERWALMTVTNTFVITSLRHGYSMVFI